METVQKYFATYRYFGKETILSQEYIDILADRKDIVEHCDIPDITAISSIIIQIDFEKTNKMELLMETNGKRTSCFIVHGQTQYISTRSFYLSIKARTADSALMGVTLNRLTMY